MPHDANAVRPVTLADAASEYLQTLKPEARAAQSNAVHSFVTQSGMQNLGELSESRVESFAERAIFASDPNASERVAALKGFFQYLKKKEYTPKNYGVSIRVRRVAGRTSASAVRIEQAPIEMTADGIDGLRAELDELLGQRSELVRAVEMARSDGDLRENAPYHAAREALGFHEQKIKELEVALGRAVVVEASDEKTTVGSTVSVVDLTTGKSHEWKLVGAREANAGQQRISVESPVGKQLLGRRQGEEVAVETPGGVRRQFRIEGISNR